MRSTEELSGVIKEEAGIFGVIGQKSCDSPDYIGPYTVRPAVDENIILGTAGKHMAGNITVEEIPFREVGNLSGGTTVIIG